MKKIFVTVGTHRQQFNRLIKEMDELVGKRKVNGEVFAQIGNSSFEPKNFSFTRFLDDSGYREKVKQSDLIVAHGGAGGIITSLKQGKPLVVVPRLEKFGEHTNDHQLDLAQAMESKGKVIACVEIKELEGKIKKAWNFKPRKSQQTGIIKALEDFFGGMK